MLPPRNRTCERFGRLVVVATTPGRCQCACDCGSQLEVATNNLVSGNTQSCGCLQRERSAEASRTHGKTDSPEYRIWLGMVSRCYNENRVSYVSCGAVGVVVTERWHDFANFLEDMGPRPSPSHTVDRFPDGDGNYEPSNCRWATMKEQGNNRKNNVLLTKDGRTRTASQWEEELGLCRGLIYARLQQGWSEEAALAGPKKKRGVRRPRGLKKGPVPEGFRR